MTMDMVRRRATDSRRLHWLLLVTVGSTARGGGTAAVPGKTTTISGCRCKPSSYEDGQLVGHGCLLEADGKTGWCDVEPGCDTAQERTADYDGFDECVPEAPITTISGCRCKPSSYEDGQLVGHGCLLEADGKTGWCDVEPGCDTAQERTADYDGFDECVHEKEGIEDEKCTDDENTSQDEMEVRPPPVVTYTVLAKAKIRQAALAESKPIGNLEVGETVTAVETKTIANGQVRIRFERQNARPYAGWVSLVSQAGKELLAPIKMQPNDLTISTVPSQVYVDDEKPDAAELNLRRAITSNQEDGQSWLRLGLLLSHLGRLPESAVALMRANKLGQLQAEQELQLVKHKLLSASRKDVASWQCQPESIPALTKEGFKKMVAPAALVRLLQNHLQHSLEQSAGRGHSAATVWRQEDYQGILSVHPETGAALTRVAQLNDSQKLQIEKLSSPIVLSCPHCVYGVRMYAPGASFKPHVDHGATHVASIIINVAQQLDKPWPLQIRKHDGVLHEVLLDPGQMLLYESARLVHSRIQPLIGKWAANTFVHFMPEGWASDWSKKYESSVEECINRWMMENSTSWGHKNDAFEFIGLPKWPK